MEALHKDPDVHVPIPQRVGGLTEIPRLLRDLGFDPAPVVARAGLSEDMLASAENTIPFPQAAELMMACIEATGRPDFPVLIGTKGRLVHLGLVGELMSYAPNLGQAMVDLAANHPRYVRGSGIYLLDWEDGRKLIAHRVHHPGQRGSMAFSTASLTFGSTIFRELSGAGPVQVLFSSMRPEVTDTHTRTFGPARLKFDSEHNGLVYAASDLQKPNATANPMRYAQLRAFILERWACLQPDIRDQVLRVLVPSVLTGTSSLDSTADMLGLHPKALNRSLAAAGINFRTLVNEARFELACQFLRDGRMSTTRLASVLGYAESTAFSRFFARMAGTSPSKWLDRERESAGGRGQI